jgi:hypothetical protein
MALDRLLEQLLPQEDGERDLFACWISDERLPMTERTITRKELAQESFSETSGHPLLFKIRDSDRSRSVG